MGNENEAERPCTRIMRILKHDINRYYDDSQIVVRGKEGIMKVNSCRYCERVKTSEWSYETDNRLAWKNRSSSLRTQTWARPGGCLSLGQGALHSTSAQRHTFFGGALISLSIMQSAAVKATYLPPCSRRPDTSQMPWGNFYELFHKPPGGLERSGQSSRSVQYPFQWTWYLRNTNEWNSSHLTNISRAADRSSTGLVVQASLTIKMICWGGGSLEIIWRTRKTIASSK